MNNNHTDWDDYDVVAPKEPVFLSVELSPVDVELAFASEGYSLREKVMMALIVAMMNDPSAIRDPSVA
jgi:hypothetical protein